MRRNILLAYVDMLLSFPSHDISELSKRVGSSSAAKRAIAIFLSCYTHICLVLQSGCVTIRCKFGLSHGVDNGTSIDLFV